MKSFVKKAAALLLCGLFVITGAGCGSANPDSKVASVDGTEITRGQLDSYAALYTYMLGYDPSDLNDEGLETILGEIVNGEALGLYYQNKGNDVFGQTYENNLNSFIESARASETEFLDTYSITDEDLTEFYRYQYLSQTFMTDVKAEHSDEEIAAKAQAYYDEHKDDYKVDEEIRASVILTDSQEKADDIKARLDGGADFARLAAEESTEPNSSANGGDIGYFTRNQLSENYSESIFALKTGEISDAIQTKDGFVIMKVTDRNDTGIKSFESVANDIRNEIYNDLYRQRLEEIKGEMTIETEKVKA